MVASGESARLRFLVSSPPNIRNQHTRLAYSRAVGRVPGLVRGAAGAVARWRAAAARGNLDLRLEHALALGRGHAR